MFNSKKRSFPHCISPNSSQKSQALRSFKNSYTVVCNNYTPPSSFSLAISETPRRIQPSSIYNNARIKSISSTKKKETKFYYLYYRNISKIAKDLTTNDSFRSYYFGMVFKHCQDCLLEFCPIHNTLKCSGRCSTIFHMECTDILIPICLPINLQNGAESNPSCVELYSMVDETPLLYTEWLCMTCKYEKITLITLYFNENFI